MRFKINEMKFQMKPQKRVFVVWKRLRAQSTGFSLKFSIIEKIKSPDTHQALRLTVPEGLSRHRMKFFSLRNEQNGNFALLLLFFTCAQNTLQILFFLWSKTLEKSAFFEAYIVFIRQKLGSVPLFQIFIHLFWISFLSIFTLTAN